jgi:hypothetical protein
MKNQLENAQTNDIAKFLEGNGNEISFGQLLDSKLLKLTITFQGFLMSKMFHFLW